MSPEQEPDLTDKSDTDPTTPTPPEIDPSINAQVLVEQDGPNKGAIANSELVINAGKPEEREVSFKDRSTEAWDIDDETSIKGLPVLGAEAEDASRESHPVNPPEVTERLRQEYRDSIASGTPEAEAREALHDKAGTEAMATEVKERAMALMPEEASNDLKEEYGELAATKFKEMLESKLTERKAEANTEVQTMIDELSGSSSLPEALSVEGLTEIGTEATEAARNSHPINPPEAIEGLKHEYQQSLSNGVPETEAREGMAVKAGTEAKAAEVKKRAMDLATKAADEALREEYGELAATIYKEGLESEIAEKKNAADDKARAMIDALKAGGELPPELLPPETPEEPDDRPAVAETAFR
jgi:hypothetical protein